MRDDQGVSIIQAPPQLSQKTRNSNTTGVTRFIFKKGNFEGVSLISSLGFLHY